MGCGKTTVGKLLAERLELPFVDLDDIITERTGQTVNELFQQHGEFDFRACEAQVLRDMPRRFHESVLACGGGTPLHFDNIDFLNQHYLTIFLDIDAEHLIARLEGQRDHRPLLKRDDWQQFLQQLIEERRTAYERAEVTVEVMNGDSQAATESILEALPQLTGH